jgi:sulfatase modifying factor 1
MSRARMCTCAAFLLLLGALLFLPVAAAAAPPPTPQALPDTAMALIPAGEFVMGDESDGDDGPAHKVRLNAFYIDRCEVTNAQYEAFCKATGAKLPMFWGMDAFRSGPGFPDHPVTGVAWDDAREYAKWRGKRLPTEAEWERAARGGVAGQPYVTGKELDTLEINFARSHQGGTLRVASYAPNGFGLYDMAGNVLEWVADRYGADYYATSPPENPTGPDKGRFRVIRGGGWHTGPGCMGVSHRNALPSNWLDFNVGFRCARDEKPGQSVPQK